MLICSQGVYNLGEVLNLLIVADCDVCGMCVCVAGQMRFQAKRVWPRPDAFSLFSKTHGCISN